MSVLAFHQHGRRSRDAHNHYRAAVAHARSARSVPSVPLSQVEPGDVLDAFVDYSDGGYKRRPVVVAAVGTDGISALRCTTQLRHVLRGCLPLAAWAEAGLARPTAVYTDAAVRIHRVDLIRRVGRLVPLDAARLGVHGKPPTRRTG